MHCNLHFDQYSDTDQPVLIPVDRCLRGTAPMHIFILIAYSNGPLNEQKDSKNDM